MAEMNPKKIIILDIYENGAYDVQQELRIAYGKQLNLQIAVGSPYQYKFTRKKYSSVTIHRSSSMQPPTNMYCLWNITA